MPFSSDQIKEAGYASLDYYLKNTPVDQIATERPLLKKLLEKKKPFPGGKQFIVEQLRTNYGSNFQWYNCDKEVTYNKRNTLAHANFPWRSFHDGFEVCEDEMVQNGIILTDEKRKNPPTASEGEKVQLVNLFNEKMEVLGLGLEQKLDLALHQDGTASPEALVGLDGLISVNPTTGVIGGIDRATKPWWRNHIALNLTKSNLLSTMEKVWRACIRNGGKPDFIIVGQDFLDAYAAAVREFAHIEVMAGRTMAIEGGISEMTFKGIPLVWDPAFDDLDAMDCPSPAWSKRCYMLNMNHLRLRTIDGHWMLPRTPSRDKKTYVHSFAITGKSALTVNRMNAHALITIS
jgi:hypothetical protein